MKTNWLFPHRYRLIGWLLFVPAVLLGLACMYAEFQLEFLTIGRLKGIVDWPVNLTDELATLGVMTGLLFIAFARERVEDEMISRLRLESLQWAVYLNYLILGVAVLLIHGDKFIDVLIYNLFTVLIVFIIRFRLLLRKQEREVLAL